MKTDADLGSQKARIIGKGRVWLHCVVCPGQLDENEVLENMEVKSLPSCHPLWMEEGILRFK